MVTVRVVLASQLSWRAASYDTNTCRKRDGEEGGDLEGHHGVKTLSRTARREERICDVVRDAESDWRMQTRCSLRQTNPKLLYARSPDSSASPPGPTSHLRDRLNGRRATLRNPRQAPRTRLGPGRPSRQLNPSDHCAALMSCPVRCIRPSACHSATCCITGAKAANSKPQSHVVSASWTDKITVGVY
ncbi:hypothetical protein FKP32DRAFT_654544 [Trametes sanguinea]|nr:hypothetical protein FKP32DRAFT_654544 [Trametes sanguinea]